MTILEPNKHEQVNRVFWGTAALLILVTSWSIFIYNETVLLNHELHAKEQAHNAAIAKNTELKNTRYAQTDVRALRKIAEAHGLIKVRTPGYVNVSKELLARAL